MKHKIKQNNSDSIKVNKNIIKKEHEPKESMITTQYMPDNWMIRTTQYQ